MARRLFCAPDNTSDFEALRSRHGQSEAILVAYDTMELDGEDVRGAALAPGQAEVILVRKSPRAGQDQPPNDIQAVADFSVQALRSQALAGSA